MKPRVANYGARFLAQHSVSERMVNKRKSRSGTERHPGSLLSPQSMGGIIAGKGFDFQTRYAACQVPVWLLEAPFYQLFYEGTGDIDIRYEENGQSSRIHIQVKD